jgi:hypothetical protein
MGERIRGGRRDFSCRRRRRRRLRRVLTCEPPWPPRWRLQMRSFPSQSSGVSAVFSPWPPPHPAQQQPPRALHRARPLPTPHAHAPRQARAAHHHRCHQWRCWRRRPRETRLKTDWQTRHLPRRAARPARPWHATTTPPPAAIHAADLSHSPVDQLQSDLIAAGAPDNQPTASQPRQRRGRRAQRGPHTRQTQHL